MKSYLANIGQLIALSANYPHDDAVDLQSSFFKTVDGYPFIYNPLLKNVNDVTINRDSIFYLTSSNQVLDFIKDEERTSDLGGFATFYSSALGSYIVVNSDDTLSVSTDITNNNIVFRIISNGDGTVSIFNGEKLVTVDRTPPFNLTLQDEIAGDVYNRQKFKIEFFNNTKAYITTLFTNVHSIGPSVVRRFVSYSPVDYTLRAIGTIVDDDYVYDNPYLFDITGYEGVVNVDGLTRANDWIKYYNSYQTSPQNPTSELNLTGNISGVRQNYLVSTAYKTQIDRQGTYIPEGIDSLSAGVPIGSYNIDFLGLKNIESTDYRLAIAPILSGDNSDVITRDNIELRNYHKIFSGTGQDTGHENIFLEYTTDFAKSIKFEQGKITYFHYPKNSASLALSAALLEYNGSLAGSSPFRSDKIWQKNADYESKIYWGDDQRIAQRGVWLCSWLSGNVTSSTRPVWKDRWYNSGYVTQFAASTAETTIYTENDPIVWDEDSVMQFQPGSLYKYHRFGDVDNTSVVRTLTGTAGNLKLHLENWDETTIDSSPYRNDAVIHNYTGSMITPDGVKTDGINQSCEVVYNSSYDASEDLSVSFWAKADNWTNVDGHYFANNDFRGGWGIGYLNGFLTPIIPVYENTYGHVLFTNNTGKTYATQLMPISGTDENDPSEVFSNITSIAVDKDLYTWILDDQYKRLYKVDFEGDIVKQINFDSDQTLTNVKLGPSSVFVSSITGSNTQIVSGFNLYNSDFESITNLGDTTLFDINLSGGLVTADVPNLVAMAVDETDTLFAVNSASVYIVSGDNVREIYEVPGGTNKDMKFDKNNDIWVLGDINKFYKLDLTDIAFDNSVQATLSVSGSIGTSTTEADMNIGFTIDNNTHYAWIVESANNNLYKYDLDGVLETQYQLLDMVDFSVYNNHVRSLMSFKANGDFTSYDWYRKYRYIANGKQPVIEANLTIGEDEALTTINLTVPASSFANNKLQHFALTYDSLSGNADFYANSVLVDSASGYTNTPIYYKYSNPLIIGADTGKLRDLNEEVLTDNLYFKGTVDDVRIYDITLNISDISHIYRLKYNMADMYWQMPTSSQSIIEEIERFFKHKLPGQKSHYYNLVLADLGITDVSLRAEIEEIIKETIPKIAPAYTELYKIIWE